MSTVAIDWHDDGVALVQLNRPDALNALTWEAMERFADTVTLLENSDSLRAVVIHGAGRAFCSGGDLFELHQYPRQEDGLRLATLMGDALARWARLPSPTIAAIEGLAMGGGAEIALACDLRIMAEDASFSMMHVKLAISPAWGGGQRLRQLVGYGRALEWLAAARSIEADEALDAGVANQITPPGQALPAARDLAARIASHNPAAVTAVKRSLRGGLHSSAEEALRAERAEFPPLWAADPHLQASEQFVARKNGRVRQE